MEAWVSEETAAADLGDARLNQRLGIVLNRLGDKPSISIPAASKGWAEIQAAYRFFSNDKVTMKKILGAHEPATLERIKSHPVVLLINDTTQLNYVVERKKEGLGTIRTQEYTVTVGMSLTRHPPYRSVHAALPHTAPASGNDGESARWARDEQAAAWATTAPECA